METHVRFKTEKEFKQFMKKKGRKDPMTLLINDTDSCEIIIRADGKVVWVNTDKGCVLRVQGIETLTILDNREAKEGHNQ